jgi:uncharacterized protein YjiS (DUF1127 family)
MSIVVWKSSTAQRVSLHAVLDWFRHARVAISIPRHDVEDLSDRALKDIGAERKDIARAMDRELGRSGLLDIGWQQPRRGLHR